MLNEQRTRIRLQQPRGKAWFDLNTVVFIKGQGNYCQVMPTQGRPVLVSATLVRYERMLPGFWRVSKSCLVNPIFIEQFLGVVNRHPRLHLANDQTIPVSRRKYAYVKKLWTEWKKNRMNPAGS